MDGDGAAEAVADDDGPGHAQLVEDLQHQPGLSLQRIALASGRPLGTAEAEQVRGDHRVRPLEVAHDVVPQVGRRRHAVQQDDRQPVRVVRVGAVADHVDAQAGGQDVGPGKRVAVMHGATSVTVGLTCVRWPDATPSGPRYGQNLRFGQ